VDGCCVADEPSARLTRLRHHGDVPDPPRSAEAMFDLHAHVLPGIDDGPRTMEEAVALAAAAETDGVTTLCATPHARPDHPRVHVSELAERTADLQAATRHAGLAIEIVSGAEVDLFWAQRADDEALTHASYGQRGTDLLVETPYGELPPIFEDLLFRLTLRGYRVLLAHPERSPTLRRSPARLKALVARGVLVQVTAAALAGPRRSQSRRFALDLVRSQLAHVIASDVHRPVGGPATLSEGVQAAARRTPQRATWMVTAAPAAVIAGVPLPRPPSEGRHALRGLTGPGG
jgi:protein-tyrosine phosphatase